MFEDEVTDKESAAHATRKTPTELFDYITSPGGRPQSTALMDLPKTLRGLPDYNFLENERGIGQAGHPADVWTRDLTGTARFTTNRDLRSYITVVATETTSSPPFAARLGKVSPNVP